MQECIAGPLGTGDVIPGELKCLKAALMPLIQEHVDTQLASDACQSEKFFPGPLNP